MDELVTLERPVTLVNRSGQVGELFSDGVQIVRGDATDPDQVAAVCADAEIVFHCAQPGYANWPEQFPPISRGILDGLSGTRARLIVGENLYAYGPVSGPIREDLPYAATTRKGKVRAEMAHMLLDAHQAGRVRVAIGRASDFYGPRVLSAVNVGDLLFEAALAGKTANLVGDLDQSHTYTYIKDFGRALVTLSDHDEALGQAWHVPSAETITTRQFVELVEAAVGRPVKVRMAGRLTLSVIGLFVPEAGETKEMLYEFEKPFVVDHSKFERAFGVDVTSHREAIKETLAWYSQYLDA
jgi:nucleoside-diphosphate-sugar epimerase